MKKQTQESPLIVAGNKRNEGSSKVLYMVYYIVLVAPVVLPQVKYTVVELGFCYKKKSHFL